MTKQKRNKILTTLLYNFWISADFESDFESDWHAVYKKMKAKKFNEIPDPVLQMIEVWYHDNFEEV
jgi:hypothetical protein